MALFLEFIAKFNDEDPVLGHLPHESDESDLSIDVHRGRPTVGPVGEVRVGHF